VRKSRARALGAGRKVVICGLGTALTFAACTGPDLISLGGALPNTTDRFISPTGDDRNPGTTWDSPWKTFPFALANLEPGWTLKLLAGTYDAATTKTLLNVRCADATAQSTVPDATLAKNGLPGMPITVRADGDRTAFLHGDGTIPPISIDSCQYWSIEGIHAGADDAPDHPPNPDTGSVVVLDGANSDVTLTRLLLRHPNLYQDADLVRIGDGASVVTVDHCELYDFHHNGIEARRSSSLVIRLNYLNSRDTTDPPGTSVSDDPARGDTGVVLEETNNVYAENNIVEDVSVGFSVLGRAPNATPSVPGMDINNNHLFGNIVYQPASVGFRIDSRCASANPCDGPHTISGTQLSNDVVVGGALGISDAGSRNTTIDKCSVFDAARGVYVVKEPQNLAIPASMTTTSTLVMGFQSVGFFADIRLASWAIAHCAASGGYDPANESYEPDDPAHVMDKVMAKPEDVGVCRAYIPAGPLRTGALNDVGANVIYQYDETGTLMMDQLVWGPVFAGCGGTVMGVNDMSKPSCETVNQRLDVRTPACPLP
jgi:hypothetical protein